VTRRNLYFTEKVIPWPEPSIDRRATAHAFEELGPRVSINQLVARAQEIKDELIRSGK
jgi:hypothetical protein